MTFSKAFLLFFLLVVGCGVPGAAGQPVGCEGSCGLSRIHVEDQHGKPVSGASIELIPTIGDSARSRSMLSTDRQGDTLVRLDWPMIVDAYVEPPNLVQRRTRFDWERRIEPGSYLRVVMDEAFCIRLSLPDTRSKLEFGPIDGPAQIGECIRFSSRAVLGDRYFAISPSLVARSPTLRARYVASKDHLCVAEVGPLTESSFSETRVSDVATVSWRRIPAESVAVTIKDQYGELPTWIAREVLKQSTPSSFEDAYKLWDVVCDDSCNYVVYTDIDSDLLVPLCNDAIVLGSSAPSSVALEISARFELIYIELPAEHPEGFVEVYDENNKVIQVREIHGRDLVQSLHGERCSPRCVLWFSQDWGRIVYSSWHATSKFVGSRSNRSDGDPRLVSLKQLFRPL